MIWNKLLWPLVLAALLAQAPARADDFDIGFLAFRGEARAREEWSPLLDSLHQALPGHRFEGHFLTQHQLDRRLAEGSLDFVVTNPAHFVLNRGQGLNWLASWLDPRFGSARESVAGSLWVRADSGITHPEQLTGRRVGAIHDQAFGGYLLVAEQLRRQGLDPAHWQMQFAGYPVDALLYLLRDGALSGAMLPACVLESMVAEGLVARAEFRALMVQSESPCVRSTPLYPGWSFAVVGQVDEGLLRSLTRALLDQEQDGRPLWGAPIRLDEVERLLAGWQLGPGATPPLQLLRQVLVRHWQWLAAAGLVLLALVLHHVRVSRLLRRRTRERDRLHGLIQHKEQELARARQATLLGEMATGLAHELNQPLSAIQAYAQAGELVTEEARSREAFGQISRETERGAAIIRRFRQWATQPLPGPAAFEPAALCQALCERLGPRAEAGQVRLCCDTEPGEAYGVAPAVEQILTNLLGNSLDAYRRQQRAGTLRLGLSRADGGWCYVVEDSAGGVEQGVLDALGQSLPASRVHGLGIGLLVSYRLAQRLGGRLRLENTGWGTRAELFLPEEA